MKASEIKPSGRFFGMFASRSSAGKDCAAASFPTPMLVIDTDLRKGIVGAASWGVDLSKIEFKSFPPMSANWKTIEKELEGIWNLFQAGQRPYETIVVASITTMVRLFMNESIEDRSKGKFMLSAPVDYKFEGQVALQVFDYLRSMPCHVIIDAHLVKVYGKDPAATNEYAPDVVIGEEISIRHRLGENMAIYFDELYKFTKSHDGIKHYVEFRSDIARTLFSSFPKGPQDITNKNFYKYWLELIEKGEKK